MRAPHIVPLAGQFRQHGVSKPQQRRVRHMRARRRQGVVMPTSAVLPDSISVQTDGAAGSSSTGLHIVRPAQSLLKAWCPRCSRATAVYQH